jgi:hypothetical protein
MNDIFISYSRADQTTAQMLANILEKEGWSVWWDRSLLPGDRFDNIIKGELQAAKCVVVLWSSNSVESDWVKDEAAEGAKRGVLIPLLN